MYGQEFLNKAAETGCLDEQLHAALSDTRPPEVCCARVFKNVDVHLLFVYICVHSLVV